MLLTYNRQNSAIDGDMILRRIQIIVLKNRRKEIGKDVRYISGSVDNFTIHQFAIIAIYHIHCDKFCIQLMLLSAALLA